VTPGLGSIPLFASLSKSERALVGRLVDQVDEPAGKHLVDEGRFAYEFFAIAEGTAEVRHGGEVLATLGPGDFFGEMAVLATPRRTASVVATSPVRLFVMIGRDFRRMTEGDPLRGEDHRHDDGGADGPAFGRHGPAPRGLTLGHRGHTLVSYRPVGMSTEVLPCAKR